MSEEAPVKIKLRRLKPQLNVPTAIDEDIIQRNLQPLQENIQKKIRAQEAYYSKNEDIGVSPLIRDRCRRPVKTRLGVMPFGTNTSALPPKMRLRRLNGTRMNSTGPTGNNAIRMRKLRVNIAQERLNRIRSRNNAIVSSTPKKIRLRRFVPTASVVSGPQNLKVEVVNNAGMPRGPQFKHRRFKQILNHHIQLEIMELQKKTETERYFIQKVTPVTTYVKMHDRFAQLS